MVVKAEATFHIRGISPMCVNRFGRQKLVCCYDGGMRKKSNPETFLNEHTFRLANGSYGIPAPAFRNALITACRIMGFKMTIAKMSIFVIPDGVDARDGTPLVGITKGAPEYVEFPVMF